MRDSNINLMSWKAITSLLTEWWEWSTINLLTLEQGHIHKRLTSFTASFKQLVRQSTRIADTRQTLRVLLTVAALYS